MNITKIKHKIICPSCNKEREVSYNQFLKSKKYPLKCKKCSSKINGFKIGFNPWNKDKKTGIVPKSVFTIGSIPWNKGLNGFNSQEKHYNWQGGITPINTRIRNSNKYIEFRKKILERDNYTCKNCNKRGGDLECHHIKSFSKFPELRFSQDNVITLCVSCHQLTDNFGAKKIINSDATKTILSSVVKS